MYLSSAKAIWEYLRRSYSMKQDMSACYDLKRKIFNTKQGNLSITEYFGVLNGFWIELDQYQNLKMECSKDTATLNTVVERDRIFDFLAGLNAEFDPIRVQILGKEKFPDLNEVFYTVRSEETRRQAMLHEQPPDVSALVASKTTRQGPPPSSSKNVRDKFYCEHCNRSGHTKDRCFKLHGREQVLSRGGGSRNMHQYQAHVATHVQDTESFEKRGTDLSSFSQNDVERLKSMLDSMSKPSGSGSLAVTGKSLCSRSLTGENISDLESESESESEFLILGPSLPKTPISVPSLEPELSPSLSLSPSSTPESEPVSVPGPSRPSVLQESAPPAPTLVYQRRSKPDLLQKQIQSPEPEVSTENDSSSDDCAISDTCDTNPVDLPIALRKDKRSCPSLYRHPISQYVSTKHLSTQYQSFIAAIDYVKIPSSVEEALQNRNWVQAMDEEMRALKKMEMI
ncbi:hypothetical protein KIW84_011401 [Lathyrus oleraceus]|uniref:Retrotransposon gag domain-containing protein n=1 Tax=Pisum sativum TaxID=3888 RepID=A0A9D5BEU2_PEA|nr:hypothetical protein KIW84_011401 [Pisum sativum]